MLSDNTYDLDVSYVERIFKYPGIRVMANPLQMSLLNTYVAKTVEEYQDKVVQQIPGITHTRHDPMRETIDQMFFGQVTPLSGIEELDNDFLTHPVEQLLTIRDCVVLWKEEGAVAFVDPRQSTIVYDILSGYISEVEHRKLHELNYRQPPKEDMEAMSGFMGNIEHMARTNRTRHHGSSAWNALLDAFYDAIVIEGNTQDELNKNSASANTYTWR